MSRFSFEDVERVLAAEKASSELTDLPSEFYSDVARYVAELDRELEHGDELRRELIRAEIRNVLQMVREIHSLRVVKALEEVRRGRLPAPLLERERSAFSEVGRALGRLYADLIAPAVKGEAPPAEPRNVALIMLADIPQIVGDDMRRYGPFSKGDVANLPRRSAGALVERGVAKKIEISQLRASPGG